jgi:ribonuclease E
MQSPPPAPADIAYTGPGYAPATPVKIEWPADLQQVESDPDKVKATELEAAPESSAPRPKRVRQPLPPVSNEPLVQIETDRPEASGPGKEEKAPV